MQEALLQTKQYVKVMRQKEKMYAEILANGPDGDEVHFRIL